MISLQNSQQSLAQTETFDVVIIGGGPAGVQCAMWLKMMQIDVCIFEKRPALGGLQHDNPFPYQPIALFEHTVNGRQVGQTIHQSAVNYGVSFRTNVIATEVNARHGQFDVTFFDGDKSTLIQTTHLVISSGTTVQTGGYIASERVLIGPGDHIIAHDFSGKRVAILGGGDNAFENCLYIQTKNAALVHIYARTVRARKEFVQAVPTERIFIGSYLVNSSASTVNAVPYDVIVVMYGWVPSLPYLAKLPVAMDDKGFLITHPQTTETSVHNLFAIGDVANRMPPSCIAAMADGIVAARTIRQRITS